MLSTELERHAKFFAAVLFLVFVLGTLLLAQHCALHHPPPCDPTAAYPDPCAYGITETVSDAGAHDAR